MQKIIIERQEYGWSAMFFNIPKMPDDIEVPLSHGIFVPVHIVAETMQKRFPEASIVYRSNDKTCFDWKVAAQ